MRDWPRPALSRRDRFVLWASDRATRFADRFPRLAPASLKEATESRQFFESGTEKWDALPPQELAVSLRKILFYDLVAVEEYEALARTLDHLHRRLAPARGSLARSFRNEPPGDWIRDVVMSGKRGASTGRGWVFGDKDGLQPLYFAEVTVATVSSSYLCLTILATPTTTFQEAYRSGVMDEVRGDFRLSLPDWRSFMTRWAWRQGFMESITGTDAPRSRRLNALLLDANRQVVGHLRRRGGVGMSARGPLPFTEVVGVEATSAEMPDPRGRSNSAPSYWHRMPLSPFRGNPYVHQWLRFDRLRRDARAPVPAHQLVASLPDARAQADADPLIQSEDAVDATLRYRAHQLAELLAVEARLDEIGRDARRVRDQIGSALRPSASFSVLRLRRDARTSNALNALRFQQDRLGSEVEEEHLTRFARDIRGLRRFPFRKGQPRTDFLDDWEAHVRFVGKRNEARLRVLAEAVETRLQLHSVASATALQAAVLFLTVVLLLLTLLMVPEAAWDAVRDFVGLD